MVPPSTSSGQRPGALATKQATEAAVRDLLEAERRLRALAEGENRNLRAALQLAAYTFAGAAYEAEIRQDQRILDRWTPDDWMAFFQRVAPVSEGWCDPAVLAERLRTVTQERDRYQGEVRRLQEELALRADLAASQVARPAPPPPQEEQQAEQPAKRTPDKKKGKGDRKKAKPAKPAPDTGYPGFRWPNVPDRPPAAYARHFGKSWQREGMALALVASGLSMRLEAAELIGLRFGVDGRAGSVRRMFDRMAKRGLFHKGIVRVGSASIMMLRLTDLGKKVCRVIRIPVVETELERMLRLHGGERQKEHAGAVVIFAYHARKRGWLVEVLPEVEGAAEPDVLIANDEGSIYVEVELGRQKRPKWRNMSMLQGCVALCGLGPEGRDALVREVKALGIPGRATDLQTLIKGFDEGQLWVEDWE
jgi:hypothetical protein